MTSGFLALLGLWASTPYGAAASSVCNTNSSSLAKTLYVAHQTKGLMTLHFDPSKPSSESLQILDSFAAGFQPGWICGRGDNLYSVSRTHYPTNASTSGGLFHFKRDLGGILSKIGDTSSFGNGGVYCDIHKDERILSVANIDGSTVSLYPRHRDGRLGEPLNIFKYNLTTPGPGTNDSQIQSNPHQAVFDPSGRLLVVPDRGADRVYIYQLSTGSPSELDVRLSLNMTLPPGTGPRHALFQVIDRHSSMMYLVSELDNTVRAFHVTGLLNVDVGGGSKSTSASHNSWASSTNSSASLSVKLLQTASTLGVGDNRTAPINEHLASELALSNDGLFLYVSNRGTTSFTSDTLAIFAVDSSLSSTSTPLTYLGASLTHGKIPRHFSLSNDAGNSYVAVANEVTNNILVFKRNSKTGLVDDSDVVGNLTIGSLDTSLSAGPMAVVWA